MQSIVSLLLTGALAFAATNTDDLLMMTCFLSATNSPFEKRCVVIGQYLGFIALLALSAGGSFGASEVSGKWIGLLGIYPICKGIGELRKRFLSRGVSVKKPWGYRRPAPFLDGGNASGAWLNPQTYGVALVTVGCGADNLSVYIPLFAQESMLRLGILLILFLVLLGAWCLLAYMLAHLAGAAHVLERCGSWAFPCVFIVLGGFILGKTGALSWIFLLIAGRGH